MYPDMLKYIFFVLSFNGCNPMKGYSKSQILLFISCMIVNFYFHITVTANLILKRDTIEIAEVLESLSGIFFVAQAGGKMISLFYLKNHIRLFLHQMQTVFWQPEKKPNKNEDQEFILNKRIKKTAILYLLVTLATLLMFLYIPIFSEEDKLIFEAYRPPGFGYLVNLGIQGFVGFSHIMYGIFPFDMIFMILVTCTTFQFKLLNEELKSLFDEDLSTGEAIEKFHERFKRCVEHYDFLLEYTKTINDRYSLHLAVLFFTLFGCDTMEMYRIAKSTTIEAALRSILFVVAGVAQIFLMCYTIPAQRLTDEANKAGENIYFSLWYNYPKYAKPLINLIARSNKQVKIVPCGILELSLEQGLAVSQ
nr:unnamed protein product [Callosobruchus chinensis]